MKHRNFCWCSWLLHSPFVSVVTVAEQQSESLFSSFTERKNKWNNWILSLSKKRRNLTKEKWKILSHIREEKNEKKKVEERVNEGCLPPVLHKRPKRRCVVSFVLCFTNFLLCHKIRLLGWTQILGPNFHHIWGSKYRVGLGTVLLGKGLVQIISK